MKLGAACVLAAAAACASPRSALRVARPAPAVAQPAPRAARSAPTRLTPDVVLATIRQAYLPGMQRCYRRYLKGHEHARGRVILSFTVDASGRTREAAARGVAHQVDGCIVAQLARWRFPAPARGDARFALGLDLVRD